MQKWVIQGSAAGSRDLLLSPLTAYISQEQVQLASPAKAVCAVHSMRPLPNYVGLLLTAASLILAKQARQ